MYINQRDLLLFSLDYCLPGEDDVTGLGQDEDRRRVLAGLVVQLRGNLMTLPDLEPLHRP